MASEKIRLGGMALQNGVLVHGPTAWAAAVRTPAGELKVAAAKKRFVAARLDRPLLRGPARLVEAIAILPDVRRRLPEARLPFERPAVLVAMAASAVAVRVVRGGDRALRLDDPEPRPPAREGAREARPRAAAPARDGRPVAGAARSRRGSAPRVPRARRMTVTERARRLPPEVFDLPVDKMRE